MKTSTHKQPKAETTKPAQPVEPSGSVNVAGEKVRISLQSVSSKPGSSPKTILKSLKEASKKSIFPFPSFAAHE